jgi:hypothetical protein
MASNGANSDAIIIGTGPSGISMAHSLRHKLGFTNFMAGRYHWEEVNKELIFERCMRSWTAPEELGEPILTQAGKYPYAINRP